MIARHVAVLRRGPSAAALLVAAVSILSGCPSAGTPGGSGASGGAAVGRAEIDAALVAAEEYLGRNECTPARLILETLLARAPGESRAHELLGQVLYVEATLARARGEESAAALLAVQAYERYRAAVECAAGGTPGLRAGLHQSAGEIASAAGLPERALEHFQEASTLQPLEARHPLHAAQMLMILGRVEPARTALERALRLDPDEPYAHASMALVQLAAGDRAAALAAIEEARRIDPMDLALRVQEARVRRLCDQPEAGLRLLSGLDAAARAEEGVAGELAACARNLGDPAGAASAWEHRYRHHPGQWRAAVRAAEANLEAGERERAWALLREAAARAPEAPEVRELEHRLAHD